jgi:hypothetical protein
VGFTNKQYGAKYNLNAMGVGLLVGEATAQNLHATPTWAADCWSAINENKGHSQSRAEGEDRWRKMN